MSSNAAPVTFVWTGDLHLEEPGRPNHRDAHIAIEEIDSLIKPDFVQFAGDNVQHARDVEWAMFRELTDKLHVPWHAIVGDHDAHHDSACHSFRENVGATHGAFTHGGVRFILLNTMEYRPLGLSEAQVLWFRYEVDAAVARGERVVVFQHHYPFKVCESFDGPGIGAWRDIVQTRPIAAVLCGHTHYSQIANDGRNVYVATRSIGDPEGGAAGYAVVHLQGEDLALKHRSVEDKGPFAMITHPRQLILCRGPQHIVSGPDEVRVRVWSRAPVAAAQMRIDGGEWTELQTRGPSDWHGPISGHRLAKGEHAVEVQVLDANQAAGTDRLTFQVDRSARFTAVPRVEPAVKETKYC